MSLVQGLKINLTLDSLGLEKGLSSVRRHLRATQSEANRHFQEWKHGEKSLENYNKVVKSSERHIDSQKRTLEALKRRQQELTKARDESIDADGNATNETKRLNDALNSNAREISEVENKLGYHERQLQSVTEEYKRLAEEQRIANSRWTKLGNSIERTGNKFTKFGDVTSGIGSKLTNSITKPALGVGTAVAGMFTGLGVKRLVAIDEANAKMKGLGYDAEKYSESVKNAVDGTLLTYAEGMDITASALSVGIENGAELEKYIRMIGDASAATGRESGETAQIFGRVVGGGKLMTQELNQIEHGMPGFSKAMAEHLGVPEDEFRKMVTAGQVSSDDFLTVMDDFSGTLSEEMAQTFPGLVKNTFSRIGKIGEEFWGSTYEKLKGELGKFAELLTSEEIKQKAKEWGEIFADMIGKIIGYVHRLIDWWSNLSGETKRLIGVLSGVAIAAGPFLMVIGKISSTIGRVLQVIGPVIGAIGELGGAMALLTNPITLVVLGITSLVTGFVIAYNKSETFREIIQKLIETFKQFVEHAIESSADFREMVGSAFERVKEVIGNAVQSISEFVGEMFDKIKVFWEENGEQVMEAIMNSWDMFMGVVEFVAPAVGILFEGLVLVIANCWDSIKTIISGALDVILGVVQVFSGLFTGDFSQMWEGVKTIFSGALNMIWGLIKLTFLGRVIETVASMVSRFVNLIKELWNKVTSFFKNMFNSVVDIVSNLFKRVVNFGNDIKDGFTKAIRTTRDNVVELFTKMKDKSIEIVDKIVGGVKAMPGKMKDALIDGKNKVVDGIKSLGNSMASKLGEVVNGVIDGINNITSKIGIKADVSRWTVPEFSRGTSQGSPSGRMIRNGRIAEDTMALVGDKGPGNGVGTRELVEYPNGQLGLFDNDQTIFAPKGTRIFNNKQTEDILANIPRFSIGTMFRKGLSKGKDLVKGGVSWAKSKVQDILDAPKTIFNSIVNSYFDGFKGTSGLMKNLAKGSWNIIKDALWSRMKKDVDSANVGRKQPWMNYLKTTPYSPNAPIPGYPFNGGRHWGVDYATPSGTNITSPSPGTVTRQHDHGGGIVARLKQANGMSQYFLHMSSVRPGRVNAGQSVGRSGNTGAYTTGPHVHWQIEKGTNFLQNRNTIDPLSIIKKHAKGGIIHNEGLYLLGEDDKEEVVIPMERQNEAMRLVSYVANKLQSAKSTQTKSIPNVTNNLTSSNEDTGEQLKLLREANKLHQQSVEALTELVNKSFDLSISAKEMAEMTYKETAKLINADDNRRARVT